MIQGYVAPGFEPVRDAFAKNFEERGEVGAACAVFLRGEKIVDLWGGHRDKPRRLPWQEDTLVPVFSTTKGLAAMAMALLHSRGLIDHDAPVARYWPAFAQEGKGRITIRQLLGHQAGLAVLRRPPTLEELRDPDALAEFLARERPAWAPGTAQGYHSITLGWYEGEVLRRVDPAHRTLGRFFQDEIAAPLGIEFYIGTPASVPEERLATLIDFHPLETLFHLREMPWSFVKKVIHRRSPTARSLSMIPGLRRPSQIGSPALRSVEIPASNGIGQVRAIARAYGAFATGGAELGLAPATFEALQAPAPVPEGGAFDLILRIETRFSLGYLRPFPGFRFGSDGSFGTPGAGGSFGFADPSAGIGFAYAPNRMGFYILEDPRGRALREALYGCLK